MLIMIMKLQGKPTMAPSACSKFTVTTSTNGLLTLNFLERIVVSLGHLKNELLRTPYLLCYEESFILFLDNYI